MTLKVSTRHCG